MKSAVDKWWWLVKRLPRRTRIELLEALAYPEFEVTRTWVRSDPERPGCVTVEHIPLAETEAKEAAARKEVMAYSPPHPFDQATYANYLTNELPQRPPMPDAYLKPPPA